MLCSAFTSLTSRVLFGRFEEACDYARLAIEYRDGAVAIFYQATLRVYAAIALLATDAPANLELVSTLRAPLVTAAAVCPENCAHYLALFDAELRAPRVIR